MRIVNPRWGAWAAQPDPIQHDEVKEIHDADIVVLGAGISGITCALHAAQNGADVYVLEKTASWTGRGGNIGVANSSYMKANGFSNDIEYIAREWIKRCGNRCDERLLWLYLNNCGRAMDWLADIVTQPDYGLRLMLHGCLYKGETYRELIGSHMFFGGPMAKEGMRGGVADTVYAMYNEAVKLGVRFLFKTPAVQLLKENGRVSGAYAQREGGRYLLVNAKCGTVIATGDIGGNRDMCEDLSPLANRCSANVYSPKGVNSGDGHRMGLWAGGSFEDAPFPMVVHPQAFHQSNYCFLFVKPDGTRYMNEDNNVPGKCNAILREGEAHAWSIADSAWREKVPPTLEYGGGIFWGHELEVGKSGFDAEDEQLSFEHSIERGIVVTADTPEGLAQKMDVPADSFVSTFKRYNMMAERGHDDDFGKRKELLIPLDKPPYYGMKFGPALLVVVGGLRVDTGMQVLDESRKPVDGLYAIGNAAGGRYGVDYPMLIHGTSHGTALTFGFLLGEKLSRR